MRSDRSLPALQVCMLCVHDSRCSDRARRNLVHRGLPGSHARRGTGTPSAARGAFRVRRGMWSLSDVAPDSFEFARAVSLRYFKLLAAQFQKDSVL